MSVSHCDPDLNLVNRSALNTRSVNVPPTWNWFTVQEDQEEMRGDGDHRGRGVVCLCHWRDNNEAVRCQNAEEHQMCADALWHLMPRQHATPPIRALDRCPVQWPHQSAWDAGQTLKDTESPSVCLTVKTGLISLTRSYVTTHRLIKHFTHLCAVYSLTHWC